MASESLTYPGGKYWRTHDRSFWISSEVGRITVSGGSIAGRKVVRVRCVSLHELIMASPWVGVVGMLTLVAAGPTAPMTPKVLATLLTGMAVGTRARARLVLPERR